MQSFRHFLLEANSYVGREWKARLAGREVTRKVIQQGPLRGVDTVGISTDGSHQLQLIRTDTLEQEIHRDEANLASSIKNQRLEAERNVANAALISLDGFEDTIASPALRARTITALTSKGITCGGIFYKNIRDLIRDKVYHAHFDTEKIIAGKRYFASSTTGDLLAERDITKAGIEYGLFLSNQHRN